MWPETTATARILSLQVLLRIERIPGCRGNLLLQVSECASDPCETALRFSRYLPFQPFDCALPSQFNSTASGKAREVSKYGNQNIRLYYPWRRHGRVRPSVATFRAPVLALHSCHRGRRRYHQPSPCLQSLRSLSLALF